MCCARLGDAAVTPVPVPHDCADGFGAAFWRRPAAYGQWAKEHADLLHRDELDLGYRLVTADA
jgi:hypothetical protein